MTQKKISQYDYEKKGKIFEPYMRESDCRLRTEEYIVVHLDGVSFTSKYYKKLSDEEYKTVVKMMLQVAKILCNRFPSVRVAYAFSDEISLILDGSELQANYHNRINKIVSILSSNATLQFHKELVATNNNSFNDLSDNCIFAVKAFNLPKELLQYYLNWRLLACKKMIFDKKQDFNEKEDWEKFGFLITKDNNENWVETSIDFTSKRLKQQPQNAFHQIMDR